MTQLNYQEIIALSEDPNMTFEDVGGRPPTAEELGELGELGELAAAVFLQCSLEERIEVTLSLPAYVSARHLAPLSDQERADILPRLPGELAEEIGSLLLSRVS